MRLARMGNEGCAVAGKLAVIGAGLMGSGIAQVSAQAGWDVVLRDVTDAALTRGTDGIKASYDRFVAKGKMTAEDAEAALARITTTTDLDAVADVDIVVEAVFEKLEVKHEIFRTLDDLVREDAVLASNTSAIPITKIAAVTKRPERVVGAHFFSPVPMMQLCELVRGYKTSDETLATTRAFAESVGKTCIVVNRDVAGFVTTRLISASWSRPRSCTNRASPPPRTSTSPASWASATRWGRWPPRTSPASTSCCTPPATSTPSRRTRSSRRRS